MSKRNKFYNSIDQDDGGYGSDVSELSFDPRPNYNYKPSLPRIVDDETEQMEQYETEQIEQIEDSKPGYNLNQPRDYIDLMNKVLDLKNTNNTSEESKIIPYAISEEPPTSGDENIINTFPEFQLREELCACVLGYFNDMANDDQFKKHFEEFQQLTVNLKSSTKQGIYLDFHKINKITS